MLQDVERPNPFVRFRRLVNKVTQMIKASPMGGTRKVTPLTAAQITNIVGNMHHGGFTMMQVRSVRPSPARHLR